ncbi:MAG: class I SAM-dependent methyltransferase [Candidatus Magnetoovum sp. WYHC-5]|nr:class I SAM-dependent methyltransferase [Candidatus Magnetoovum sp. WYHC-5]
MYILNDSERDFLIGIDYALLTNKEKEVLARKTLEVPDGGIIVELGTAKGGATSIFHRFGQGKNVSIYSYDLNPCTEARAIFTGETNVTFIQSTTHDAAMQWIGKNLAIDLLFVDAGHMFVDIFNDFNDWVACLKKGGTIIFHDVDTKAFGGLNFLGVKLFCDTILRLNLLTNPEQFDTMLCGVIETPGIKVTFADSMETFTAIAKNAVEVIEYYRERFLDFLSVEKHDTTLDGPKILSYLGPHVKINCFIFAYILINWLREIFNNPAVSSKKLAFVNKILSHAWNLSAWNNAVTLIDYGRGCHKFPAKKLDISMIKDVNDLSKFVALEESKLQAVWQIAGPVFEKIVKLLENEFISLSNLNSYENYKRFIIFGAGPTGIQCCEELLKNNRTVIAFIDNMYINGSTFNGYSVYTPEFFFKEDLSYDAVVLGSKGLKWQMYIQLVSLGYDSKVFF